MHWRKIIRRIFGKANRLENSLLEQFYITLEKKYFQLKSENKKNTVLERIYTEIDYHFLQPQSWKTAFSIEQSLVYLYKEELLETEYLRLLSISKEFFPKDLLEYYEKQIKSNILRENILNLLKDYQWYLSVKNLKDKYAVKLKMRINWIFLTFLFGFLFLVSFDFLQNVYPFLSASKEYYLILALLTGGLGSAMSLLKIHKIQIGSIPLENLKIFYKFNYLFSRIALGLFSGLFVFLLLHINLIEGKIFPDIVQIFPMSPTHIIFYDNNIALMIFWCTLMGYLSQNFFGNLFRKV